MSERRACAALGQVPLSALFRVDDTWAILKVVDGRAQIATVKAGHMNSRFVEILAGLGLSDPVLLHPSNRIEDGVKVVARETH